MSAARDDRADDNLVELRAALRADAAGVAVALLGEPNKAASTKRTLRWGGKGSLAVEISGAKKGLWFTHEGTEGSDLFGLIRHAHGCSFPDAVTWAQNWTGLSGQDNAPSPARPRPQRAPDPAAEAEAAAEVAGRIKAAQQIARASRPVEGTPGDWYLRQARGIPRPARGWPAAIAWNPKHRAVVAVATTADGTVQAVQRIHLGDDGNKATAEEVARRDLRAAKVTNGVGEGAVVRLPGDKDGPLLLAEGPETGLSAWSATGHETWVALGGMGKVELPAGRRVVICADDDAPAHDAKHGTATRALHKALTGWRAAGVNLVVARPWPARRHDKSDLCDVILAGGADAVRARIAVALGTNSAPRPARVPVEQARAEVAEAVRAFFAPVEAHSIALRKAAEAKKASVAKAIGAAAPEPGDMLDAIMQPAPASEPIEVAALAPYTQAMRLDTGVGKSDAARAEAATTLAGMRARGDKRTIALAIPTHALGEEQAAAFEALSAAQAAGLKAAILRGRAAVDPATRAPDGTGPTMCRDLDRVDDARSAGVSVQQAVCKGKLSTGDGKPRTVKCPLFDTCAYQQQMKQKADLWIVAHESLFHGKPEAVGQVAALIVDEAAWPKGLIGAQGRHLTLSLDALRQEAVVRFPSSGMIDRASSQRLDFLRNRLLGALDTHPDGPVRRDALASHAMNADSGFDGYELEYKRRVRLLHPGQSKEARKQAVIDSAENATVTRAALVWDAVRVLLGRKGPDASGWVALANEDTQAGPTRVLRIKGLSEVKEGWRVPTLLLDALLPMDLVRHYWPDVEMVADVNVTAPHQRIRQVVDRTYAKNMLQQLDEAADARTAEGKRRANRLRDLRDMLVREARAHAPGRVLVVVQKAVEDALGALAPLPGNVELAHHNAVAGRDGWRDVAALVVVGRTQPPPAAAERIAEALTGRAIQAPAEWYERADAVRELVDGTTVPAEADRHPDPMVEAIRWQIAEGELVQIIGRARGVNRTEENPVDVLVLTDTPLPMPVAELLADADLSPTVTDRMMAAGGVAFENPTDAAAAYPILWNGRAAAKSAMQRGKLDANPYKESSIGVCIQLPRLSYRVAGQGRSGSAATYDPDLCPDPAAFLVQKLGCLAFLEIDGKAVDVPQIIIPQPAEATEPPPDDDPEPDGPPPGHPAHDPGWADAGELDGWEPDHGGAYAAEPDWPDLPPGLSLPPADGWPPMPPWFPAFDQVPDDPPPAPPGAARLQTSWHRDVASSAPRRAHVAEPSAPGFPLRL